MEESVNVNIQQLMNTNCKYCSKIIITYMMDWFQCNLCGEKIHRSCLKRLSTPGAFHGDIFFTFTCIFCASTDSEILLRDKMPWFTVVVLVIHHLYFKSLGTAKNGYFHWRIHVVKFIEKNWDNIFSKNL